MLVYARSRLTDVLEQLLVNVDMTGKRKKIKQLAYTLMGKTILALSAEGTDWTELSPEHQADILQHAVEAGLGHPLHTDHQHYADAVNSQQVSENCNQLMRRKVRKN